MDGCLEMEDALAPFRRLATLRSHGTPCGRLESWCSVRAASAFS